MKKSMLLAGAAMLLTAATPALAQSTISPGMTTEQVRDRFGAPATTRDQGDWSYWYYHNGCPVRCGSDDVVFFQNDRVVAAVLRTARRRFAGPAADDALGAASDAPAAGDAAESRATVGGVRVEQPGSGLAAPDRPRPQAREGQPGEPSTIVITRPDAAPAERVTPPVPVNRAREGRPGEPATMIITTPPAADIEENIQIAAPRPDEVVVPASNGRKNTPAPAGGTIPPTVDGPLPVTEPVANPAENTEAADTRGETSIDRKTRRERQDRGNETTATERAGRNDAKNP